MTDTEILEKLQKRVADVVNCDKLQRQDGNWNYSPYMMGLANGLAVAVAILYDTEPELLSSPEEWLEDLPLNDTPIVVQE